MRKIGIIDIGSNSVRLVLVRIGKKGSFRIFNDVKESVRLGMGMDDNLELKLSRIEAAIKTLKMFKSMCDATFVDEIIAVATAAVRKAKNKSYFLERVKNEIGIDIKVLDGKEEAFFAYWGVINSIDVDKGLIMDIGGGSTELILVENRKISNSISLPFGSINLAQNFNLSNHVKESDIKALHSFLIDNYGSIPWLSKSKGYPLIGVGGTIRNMGNVVRKSNNYPLEITHNFRMKKSDLHKIYKMAKEKNLEERKKIKGLSKDRADIFVGVSGAVFHLFEYCELKNLIVSGSGIREGIIYDYIHNNIEPVKNVLDFSINSLMSKYELDTDHAYHIYNITKSLYDQILGDEIFSVDIHKVLKTAALLHDSGINIRFYNHTQHSFYMILNAGINGLTHKELLMSAFVSALHRNKKFKTNWLKYKSIITKEDMETIRKLGLLLRIAESLDICLDGKTRVVNCSVNTEEVRIRVISDKKTDVEINHALNASEQFKKVYKKKLFIE
ncbi:exopolyphosphatase [Wukongibacter sp. M2B1]|uniref:Ppx/GppA phosphatase family protein n=1 Tax=Wukongibacter sp. M2B1 TaxID=3088895 RepID=UPI003D793A7B